MNLGHGRAGHLPDYCFIKYKYLPAWGEYEEIIKDNSSDYLHAFCQMIYAMKYLRGEIDSFKLDEYDWDAIEPYKEEIDRILHTRQLQQRRRTRPSSANSLSPRCRRRVWSPTVSSKAETNSQATLLSITKKDSEGSRTFAC